MSVRISTWVWQHSGAAGNDLLILLALADIADDSGRCWPAVAHLAEKTRLSRATIQRRLHAMAAEGRLFTKDRAGTSNLYEFRFESGEYRDAREVEKYLPQTATGEVPQSATGRSLTLVAPGEAGGASPGATGGASPGEALTINEPSSTRQKSRAKKRATAMPETFGLTTVMREWADGKGFRGDLDAVTEKFVDHHLARDSRFADWTRAWQTWIRNDIEWARGRRQQPQVQDEIDVNPWITR